MDAKNELQKIVGEIILLIEKLKTKKSNIGIIDKKIDEYGTKTITLCGGLNGCGKWVDYFNDLARIFTKLEEFGYDVWVIKLDNDCLDDIFYCTVGIEKKQEKNE